MKIITPGDKSKPTSIYRCTCRGCDCVYEATRDDGKVVYDNRDGNYVKLHCPECGKQQDVSTDLFVSPKKRGKADEEQDRAPAPHRVMPKKRSTPDMCATDDKAKMKQFLFEWLSNTKNRPTDFNDACDEFLKEWEQTECLKYWTDRVSEFYRVKWSLPMEDHAEMDKTLDTLKRLVEKAIPRLTA